VPRPVATAHTGKLTSAALRRLAGNRSRLEIPVFTPGILRRPENVLENVLANVLDMRPAPADAPACRLASAKGWR
jgi:hypothetical protein